MPDYRIRRMTAADVDAVTALEASVFPRPWSRADFLREMEQNVVARYLVLTADGAIVGYAGAWIILDECHITNIALAAEHRGCGQGRKLMTALLQLLSNLGGAYATLEVRKSNTVAQNLYTSLGFIRLGVRKRYYEDNDEDALLMVCDKLPPAEENFEEETTVRE